MRDVGKKKSNYFLVFLAGTIATTVVKLLFVKIVSHPSRKTVSVEVSQKAAELKL